MARTRKAKKSSWRFDGGDFVFGGFIFTITAGALIFPWHVYMNPDQYSAPELVYSRQAEMEGSELAYMVGGRALFDFQGERFLASAPFSEVDTITTGTVSSGTRQPRNVLDSPRRSSGLTLLAGDKRRALIMNDDGVYLVGPRYRLPGGARVRALIDRDGSSRLVTNRYEVLRVQKNN